MNDKEFEQLKDDIEDAMDHLESLQQKYRDETGVNFIRPLRLAPRNNRKALVPVDDMLDEEDYDAGILNDYGGGNIDWRSTLPQFLLVLETTGEGTYFRPLKNTEGGKIIFVTKLVNAMITGEP